MSTGTGENDAVSGAWLSPGRKVRLKPARHGDMVDLALAGRTAEVDRVEHSADGRVQVVVMLAGDPAYDLASMSQIGHRFFFEADELEPLSSDDAANPQAKRVLVASIGDAYADDGGFGPEVIARLRQRGDRSQAVFAEFGIRAMDLGEALRGGYQEVVLLATSCRGGKPGTLTVGEPGQPELSGSAYSTAYSTVYSNEPETMFQRARWYGDGSEVSRVVLVQCESARTGSELSELARQAVDEAVELVESLLDGRLDHTGVAEHHGLAR